MSSYTRTIFVGNVIEDPEGYKWIVSNVTDDNVSAVSFDAESVSATQRLNDWSDTRTCWSDDNSGNICDDADCIVCHGTGNYQHDVTGWKHSKVLARHVKDYILKGVQKVWDI